MSERNLDRHGRWRNVTISFRASPEEAALIDAKVAASGLSKQSYIIDRPAWLGGEGHPRAAAYSARSASR